ncbi:RNA polymerase II transcription factor-like protein B subunit 2 [Amylocarpus encephaloides]|uniref:RNA polymerase II transcription factor B subunit 2 n=1 Tax=Amylocarpus encephaloides TaxID=45428 RepID=A0A9P7YT63_9HELO|nr:RNA polymerase II transcription factor-like protein B subunit 2 [Amylocarpus encephaloides]
MSVSSLASFEYLERLPGTAFKKLYQQPSTALAVFRRMVPHLGKTLIMALLYMSKPFLLTDVDLMIHPDSKKQRDEALSTLQRLHIAIITPPNRDSPQTITLAAVFSHSLRLALTGGGNHQSFGVLSNDSETSTVDVSFLDEYARTQWETILHYVVSNVGGTRMVGDGPTAAVKQLLEAGKLVEHRRHSTGITQAGFSFLLQEVNAQVWTLLLLWIDHAKEMGMDYTEVLSFFFLLGSLELGRAYRIKTLKDTQTDMLSMLNDFGLVYLPPQQDHFFPTRLATTLSSDSSALRTVAAGFDSALSAGSGDKGFIIIETNYRVYAYTSSPLQIAVLSLFVKLTTRYPNMVCGRLTRESMYGAINQGITAAQVVTYLETHAHPQLRKIAARNNLRSVIPITVADQIKLWQIENERMEATPGFLFRDFDSQREYVACRAYAGDLDILKWHNDVRRMFFVSKMEPIRDFLKNQKPKDK